MRFGKINNNNLRLEGKGIFLRPVDLSDATEEYVSWLNDKEVNQFLEIRFTKHTGVSLRTYIGKVIKSPNTLFWAIVRKDTEKHIGNIKLGPIDWNHKVGDIGIMIGDKNSWGKGFATEAIRLISDYAFKTLKLHKLTAGAYASNVGSIKVFMKLDFLEEGRRKKHVLCSGEYIDVTLLAKLNEN